MLAPEELKEIEAEAAAYPQRRAACIDALNIVQRHRGWVSDESVMDIADALGISAAEVDAVATFYNLIYRRPVGKNVIHVCDSISCWLMGCGAVRDQLQKKLGIGYGQTTPDGEYTLLPVPCLGACDRAPVAMLNGETVTDLDPARIDALLRPTPARDQGVH